MIFTHYLRRLAFAVLTGTTIAIGALSASLVVGSLSPAAAQISEDAQIALEEYGGWRPHPRFGEVWVPRGVPPDWRPYQYGHWVYTDEWGWYWVSDDIEADWGWVVYHYGRWAFEPGFGWFWVPGDEWAPAWVDWRYGEEYVGWAPLPPDELIEAYEVEPTYWVFVPSRFIGAPRLRTYYVPPYRRSVILRQTRIVNRTFPVQGRVAVNPGISPAFVARVNGAPVATYRVRPRVFASTQGVADAVHVRREDLRGARGGRAGGPAGPGGAAGPGVRPRLAPVSVQRTTTVIQPNAAVTAPQPLGKNERGRLGATPPRAAQGAPAIAPAPQQPQPPPRWSAAAGAGHTAGARRDSAAAAAPSGSQPTTTAPTTAPVQREERRERSGPGGPPGGLRRRHPGLSQRQRPTASPLARRCSEKSVVNEAGQVVLPAVRRHSSRRSCGRFHHRPRRRHRPNNGKCSRRHQPRLRRHRNNGRCSLRRRLRRIRRHHRQVHARRPPPSGSTAEEAAAEARREGGRKKIAAHRCARTETGGLWPPVIAIAVARVSASARS